MLTDTPGLSATLKKLLVRAVVSTMVLQHPHPSCSVRSTGLWETPSLFAYSISVVKDSYLSGLERLITTIPTRDEEEAEADGDEVDGKSTTDEFDDDLDKDPTYELESDSVKGGDKTEDMVEDVAFKLTRVSFGDALIVPLFEHIKVSSVDEFICFCCWQYDAFEIWFITSDDFTNADILEATYPAVSKMLLISNWSKDKTVPVATGFLGNGASKVNISLIVNDEEAEQCVRALPSAFFETFS
ncbi:hypothetical protein DY000_02000560 [Brassica cretica]|uniref:Uncharacterized protein n=1 Tax=Brassica cretica TaxID=69181 RepID=A0ABQ7CEQ9_BRACR|nr:hypothetical protein DY000_02000560 [Brassica cretica]